MHRVPAAVFSALIVFAIPAANGQAQSMVVAAQSAEPGKTVLRTTSNLVLVDVVVTAKGNSVHGVERSRFHIFEDGREQAIASFDEHQPAALPGSSPPAATQLPPNTYTNVEAYPQSSAANVMLLDELNTPPPNREFLRTQMLDYMATVRPGTSLAVFTLGSDLRMVQGFTGDATQAIAALRAMKLEDFGGHLSDPQKNFKPDDRALTNDPRPFGGLHDYDPITDDRPHVTLAAVQQLAQHLRLIPGRKNLIWFAGNFPVAFDPGAILSAAHVAVYPVDARGILFPDGSRVSYAYDIDDKGGELENERFRERTKAQHAAMVEFADQTGGKAYFDDNGLKEIIARAVENGSSYYTIGYIPDAKKLDGKFHSIKVHVDDSSYKLAYRRGYFAATPDQSPGQELQPPSQLTESVVHGAPQATQILFRARVLPSTDPLLQGTIVPAGPAGEMAAELKSPAQLAVVDVTLDPRSLSFQETPAGVHQARVEFTLAAYDTNGKRVNYLIRGIQLKIKREFWDKVIADGIPVRLALDLPAGQSSLRVAVFDLDAGSVGSLEAPISVGGEHDSNSGVARRIGNP